MIPGNHDRVQDSGVLAHNSGKRVTAMMHHPLRLHVTNAEALVSTYVAINHDNVQKVPTGASIKVIFTGHFHHQRL